MGHKLEHGGLHGFHEIAIIFQELKGEDVVISGSRISYY
jgi:hypothetical protein